MRIRNTLLNSFSSVGSYLLIAILAVVLRKYFLVYLPTEYLGYEGLFSDIFAILSIADLGVGSIILYRMYPAIARNDEIEIARLMSVYKFLYRIIGFGIAAVGLILIPFLRYIIRDNSLDWSYVYTIFIIQMLVQLCSYFLAYKRVMFAATMREVEIVKIDTACTMVSNVVRIVVILLLKNYIIYLLVGVLCNVLANLWVARKVNHEYSYLKSNIKITREDINELGIFKDIKNSIFQKICGAIYGGTDSILISALLGISKVGLLSNYNLISGYVNNVFNKILNPFQQSIGNYVHSEEKSKGENLFRMFDRVSFFIACFVSVSFFCLLNPFISVVFGKQYVIGTMYALAFSVNQYVAYNHKFVCFYRQAFGKYELDKWYIALAAMLNIVFSVILAQFFGVAGIIMGTVIGHMGFWIGRVRVVYSEYISEPVVKYVMRQMINLMIWGSEMYLIYFLCDLCPMNVVGLIERGGICVVVSSIMNVVIFNRTPSFKLMIQYIRRTKDTLKDGISKK
ncbi:MAG: hypothetical protein MJZ11_06920 [Lachnospiraceae bacterium]|nr:hypothetical protein [Lachnospiraceae bacterium]